MTKTKQIRDIVYGFIELDEQEQKIIDSPEFQRLRRIKQLALTDMVYLGAVHTRFEHSLGVMQMASDMFESIVSKTAFEEIKKEYKLKDADITRCRKIVRLAALLHDVGHSPFSHASEDLMPISSDNKKYEHEHYSIEIIRAKFRETIESEGYNPIKVEEVTALLGDSKSSHDHPALMVWKELISGAIDADRADYLLRDSLHLGVNYGLYDRARLVSCLTIGRTESGAPTIAIEGRGWHVAESLIIARYQMSTQVYFHKVRRIYDHHIFEVCKHILKAEEQESFPPPNRIDEYLKYDDWYVIAKITLGEAGEHGKRILERNHFKCKPGESEGEKLFDIDKLQQIMFAETEESIHENIHTDTCHVNWYKEKYDLLIYEKNRLIPLSQKSKIIKSMMENPYRIQRNYLKNQ